ncbi:McrB family protein [Treponema denticola]|uniref:McrB family protein n=1 Tax=Treponema denticola TaxID=158 RepID=UPI00030E860C|nr:AAA family ATPase [Treponema denticola]
MADKYQKFKYLLEYFVAHLEYLQNNTINTDGYKKYIDPLVKSNSFKKTGQGYKGHLIQKQISDWEKYDYGTICITVQLHPKVEDYSAKNCYLNWQETGHNIYAKWNNTKTKIIFLGLTDYRYWLPNPDYVDSKEFSISDIGLNDGKSPNKALKDMFNLYEQYQINKQTYDMIKHYIEKLESNKNIILHGAPGTGKTFTARQIAAQMMFDKIYENLTDDEKNQIGFVQFHPSYDYTDFVEGLRPKKEVGQKEIGFERKNGVFKDFCEKAILAGNEAGTDNFEKSWNELIDKLNDDIRIEIPLVSGKGSFEVELNEYGEGLTTRTYNSDEDKKSGNWIRGQSKFFSKEQLYNIYKGLKGIPSRGHDNYRKAIVAEMKKSFKLEDYNKGTPKEEAPKFIFIIDEINRGDMSKIFGELFFSVDPAYRGTNGKVLTQYQNLIEDRDTFKNGFYIPDNVYIIGTMNDIDRSVESMDFAMRRRFVFYEITAKDSAEAMGIDYSTASPMKKLNDAIEKELGSDYQIGGSYFKEYKDKLNDTNALQELWKNNLKGLLREYLRGQRDAKTKLDELESVFYGTNTDNGQQQQNA